MDLESEFRSIEDFRQNRTSGLVTLVFTDMVGSTHLKATLGDVRGVETIQAHHACVRLLLKEFSSAKEIKTAGDSFLIAFGPPSEAVRFSLLLQGELRAPSRRTGKRLADRIGIHVGEVVIERAVGMPHPRDVWGLQVDVCSRIMSLAVSDQILMTRTAYENARQVLKGESSFDKLAWREYGPYLLKGLDSSLEIFEVGEIEFAPLRTPKGTAKAKPRHATDPKAMKGWLELIGQSTDSVRESQCEISIVREVGTDFDGDGRPDLLFQNPAGFLATWSLNRYHVLNAGFFQPNNVGDLGWKLVSACDFNCDGKPDLLFQHDDGSLAVWEMDGMVLTRSSFLNPGTPGAPDWRAIGTRGVNGSGEWQLFFQHSDGSLAVWCMELLSLAKVVSVKPGNPGEGWRLAAIADLNGDGKTELIFQHTDGSLAVWFLDNKFTRVQADLLFAQEYFHPDWRVKASIDLDSNRKSDFLFQHKDGRCAIWFMDGIDVKSSEALEPCTNPGGKWEIVGPK